MPDIVKARYTGPKRPEESADRLVRYLTRRRELVKDRGGVESYRYRQISEVYGDPMAFREAAQARATARNRDGKPHRSVYTHVIVSPESGEDFEGEDFQKLIPEWIVDRRGEEVAWFAAVHHDGNRPHVHIAAVRDKYLKRDLAEKVSRTREVCRERELVHGIDRVEEREIEREREAEIVRDQGERALERRQEEELNQRLGRECDEGLDIEF